MTNESSRVLLEIKDSPEIGLEIASLSGREAISKLFEVELLVVSRDPVDAEALVGSEAALVFQRRGLETRRMFGMISTVKDRLDTETKHASYRLVFVPRVWRLGLTETLDVFLDLSVPEIVRAKLEGLGMRERRGPSPGEFDFEIRLADTAWAAGAPADAYGYPKREFVVQYKETDLAFISRLCEHIGISFFFEHGSGRDVMVFTDNNAGFEKVDSGGALSFQARGERAGVHRLEETLRMVPSEFVVRDYNYRTPQIALTGQAATSGGTGRVVDYGSHVKTPAEAERMARIRSEEVHASRRVFDGTSDVETLHAGATFHLAHPRGDLHLLVVEIAHRATQPALGSGAVEGPAYENELVAIFASRPFRPARVTPKPRIHGVVTGIVDAADKGQYAELDAEGRYRVRFLFDTTNPGEGQASRLVRMAQPHAGAGYGMHFPLRPGVEVILTFVDGDPDRPIIAATVPNPQTQSPVSSGNAPRNVIRTGGNNEINIDDTEDGQRIKMTTPHLDTALQLGAKNLGEEGVMVSTLGAHSNVAFAGMSAVSSFQAAFTSLLDLTQGGHIVANAQKPMYLDKAVGVWGVYGALLGAAESVNEYIKADIDDDEQKANKDALEAAKPALAAQEKCKACRDKAWIANKRGASVADQKRLAAAERPLTEKERARLAVLDATAGVAASPPLSAEDAAKLQTLLAKQSPDAAAKKELARRDELLAAATLSDDEKQRRDGLAALGDSATDAQKRELRDLSAKSAVPPAFSVTQQGQLAALLAKGPANLSVAELADLDKLEKQQKDVTQLASLQASIAGRTSPTEAADLAALKAKSDKAAAAAAALETANADAAKAYEGAAPDPALDAELRDKQAYEKVVAYQKASDELEASHVSLMAAMEGQSSGIADARESVQGHGDLAGASEYDDAKEDLAAKHAAADQAKRDMDAALAKASLPGVTGAMACDAECAGLDQKRKDAYAGQERYAKHLTDQNEALKTYAGVKRDIDAQKAAVEAGSAILSAISWLCGLLGRLRTQKIQRKRWQSALRTIEATNLPSIDAAKNDLKTSLAKFEAETPFSNRWRHSLGSDETTELFGKEDVMVWGETAVLLGTGVRGDEPSLKQKWFGVGDPLDTPLPLKGTATVLGGHAARVMSPGTVDVAGQRGLDLWSDRVTVRAGADLKLVAKQRAAPPPKVEDFVEGSEVERQFAFSGAKGTHELLEKLRGPAKITLESEGALDLSSTKGDVLIGAAETKTLGLSASKGQISAGAKGIELHGADTVSLLAGSAKTWGLAVDGRDKDPSVSLGVKGGMQLRVDATGAKIGFDPAGKAANVLLGLEAAKATVQATDTVTLVGKDIHFDGNAHFKKASTVDFGDAKILSGNLMVKSDGAVINTTLASLRAGITAAKAGAAAALATAKAELAKDLAEHQAKVATAVAQAKAADGEAKLAREAAQAAQAAADKATQAAQQIPVALLRQTAAQSARALQRSADRAEDQAREKKNDADWKAMAARFHQSWAAKLPTGESS